MTQRTDKEAEPVNTTDALVKGSVRPLPTCDCHEAPEQQEYNGHTRYCSAGLQPTTSGDEGLVERVIKASENDSETGDYRHFYVNVLRDEIRKAIAAAKAEERERTVALLAELVQKKRERGGPIGNVIKESDIQLTILKITNQ